MKKIKYSRLFILGVFIYILFQGIILIIGLKTSTLVLDNDYYTMKIKEKCLVIRDEYTIKSDSRGTVDLLVDDNERVQKSQKVATVYNDYVDESINTEIYNLRKEIRRIENGKNSLNSGILSVKREQLNILEEKVKANSRNYYADTSGIVSYKYDNNEGKYSSSNLSDITKEDIQNACNNYISVNNNRKVKQNTVIYRMIDNNKVYIAFVSKDNKLFNQGDSVKIEIDKDVIDGEIYINYKKTNYYVTIVKITQQNMGIYDTREKEFGIIYRQIEALRIPKESIVEENNKMGVYIINEGNNKPEFVEIKGIYFEDDEYVYVDFRGNELKGINTIKVHDRIILKPNFINKRISKIN